MAIRTNSNPKRTSWWGISIFISLVIVSGLLLTVAGKMENPFSVFPSIVNLITTGNEIGPGGGNGAFNQNAGQNTGTATQNQTSPGTTQGQGRGGPGRGSPPTSNSTNGTAQQPPASGTGEQSQFQGQGPDQRGGGGQDSISWDQYGGLLFDLWYIAACSAVVILVSRLIKFFQRRKKRAATPVFGQS